MIEALLRRKLTEGADVTANSMKPLAAAAAKLAAMPVPEDDEELLAQAG
ncbi:hypothetical protein [Cyanobium sp. ATX-6F1]